MFSRLNFPEEAARHYQFLKKIQISSLVASRHEKLTKIRHDNVGLVA
jgi:hypothetical protein